MLEGPFSHSKPYSFITFRLRYIVARPAVQTGLLVQLVGLDQQKHVPPSVVRNGRARPPVHQSALVATVTSHLRYLREALTERLRLPALSMTFPKKAKPLLTVLLRRADTFAKEVVILRLYAIDNGDQE